MSSLFESEPLSVQNSPEPDPLLATDIPDELDRRYDLYEHIRPARAALLQFNGTKTISASEAFTILATQKDHMVSIYFTFNSFIPD